MPTAHQRLTTSLSMAESLLEIETQYATPPRVGDRKAVEGLRGGAAVLMVAAFENFLRELAIEHLENLTGPVNGVPIDKLPENMRVHSVFYSLEQAMKGPRYASPTKKADRLPVIKDTCGFIVAGTVLPRAFTDTGANPGPRIVREFFKRLGLPDVFTRIKRKFETRRRWGQRVANSFIADKLEQIVQTRNVVAHTADALNLTRTELRSSLKFLRVLGEVLHLELTNHIQGIREAAG